MPANTTVTSLPTMPGVRVEPIVHRCINPTRCGRGGTRVEDTVPEGVAEPEAPKTTRGFDGGSRTVPAHILPIAGGAAVFPLEHLGAIHQRGQGVPRRTQEGCSLARVEIVQGNDTRDPIRSNPSLGGGHRSAVGAVERATSRFSTNR